MRLLFGAWLLVAPFLFAQEQRWELALGREFTDGNVTVFLMRCCGIGAAINTGGELPTPPQGLMVLVAGKDSSICGYRITLGYVRAGKPLAEQAAKIVSRADARFTPIFFELGEHFTVLAVVIEELRPTSLMALYP